MKSVKSVRLNLDTALLTSLDEHRSRFITRTELIEEAIARYLADLENGRVKLRSSAWLAR